MSLDNLFIEGPQFSETSTIKLPQSPEKWNEVIISMVKEKFPMVDSLPMVVNFKEMAEDVGTAIGSIAITHPTLKKTCYIPVIIKGGMMFPLDIWQDEKQVVRPITEDTFETYFFNEQTFDALEKKRPDPMSQYFSDPSLWQSTYPPLQGRYAYASAGGALLGMMLESATKEDAKTFEQTLEKEPGALLAYKKSGNLDLIKSAAKKINNLEVVAAPTTKGNLLPVFVTVKKDPKKYTVLSAHAGQFVTKSSFSNQDELKYFFDRNAHLTSHDDDFMNGVEHNGTKSFKMPEKGNTGVFIQDKLGPAPDKVKEFGVYRVKRYDGVLESGFVIPEVIDFDQKSLKQMLFLGGTTASMQPSIAGFPVPTEADVRSKWGDLKDSPIQVGQTGVFLLTGEKSAIATEPIQIIRIDGQGSFRACNFAGKAFKVRKWMGSHDGHSLQKISKYSGPDYDEYNIPSKMVWVPINSMKLVSSTGADFLEKTASEQKRDHDPVRVRWTGLNYEMTGKNFDKVATTFNPLHMEDFEVEFVLRALGSSEVMAKEVIKTASQRGLAVVHGLKTMEDPAPLYKKSAALTENFSKFCNGLKSNLVKEASSIDDRQTVDAILSLNFINPENVRKLVEAMPIMMQSHFKLAEMVLAARLGADEIPHEPAVVCMHRMTEVLKGLKLLDHSNSAVAEQAKNVSKAKKGQPRQNLIQTGGN